MCAELLYWVQALINIRSVCKAALSAAVETDKEKVFVDLQTRGEDKAVLFGGPIFWACAVAADTDSDTVFDLISQLAVYVDTPSNKSAFDKVVNGEEYKRFRSYLKKATDCLEVNTSKILEKHKQYVLTQQLGMLPKDGPNGSLDSLKAEFTSSPLALLEAAVSGATYEAVPRRRPATAEVNRAAASATGMSGGEAASGGGKAAGAYAERDEAIRVMSNESLSEFEKATWLELEAVCVAGVCDDVDIAVANVIRQLEDALSKQKMWELVKSGHEDVYNAIVMHRQIASASTPEPSWAALEAAIVEEAVVEKKDDEDSDEEQDSKSEQRAAAESEDEDEKATNGGVPATRGTKRARGEE